jgi:hypothetical protein
MSVPTVGTEADPVDTRLFVSADCPCPSAEWAGRCSGIWSAMFRAFAAVFALLALSAVPAVANAKTYKGKTSQGRTATVTTGANGVVTRARVAWSVPCRRKGRYHTTTAFTAPLDAASADMVQDAGTYRIKDKRGYVGRITMSLVGHRDPARDRWTGTVAIKVQVARHGKVVDRCSASKLTWSAR